MERGFYDLDETKCEYAEACLDIHCVPYRTVSHTSYGLFGCHTVYDVMINVNEDVWEWLNPAVNKAMNIETSFSMHTAEHPLDKKNTEPNIDKKIKKTAESEQLLKDLDETDKIAERSISGNGRIYPHLISHEPCPMYEPKETKPSVKPSKETHKKSIGEFFKGMFKKETKTQSKDEYTEFKCLPFMLQDILKATLPDELFQKVSTGKVKIKQGPMGISIECREEL